MEDSPRGLSLSRSVETHSGSLQDLNMVQNGCETLVVHEDATHNYLNIENVPPVETTQVFHVNEGRD